jgi:hypothetical protein
MTTTGFSRATLPPLWTLAEAKTHLRITSTAQDADIQQKLDMGQEGILSFLGPFVDPTWSAATAPKAVKGAIHILTAYYYEDRGDGELPDPWEKIYALLAAYRDPTVA